ncbi:MAG: nickel-responsive transcriptional regulator NikR [Nitrospinota bacterium]|nr:nickel-responsive transcriptional regulator NikR [Nitrospinota bacterium]
MDKLERLSFSIEKKLLGRFEKLFKQSGYENRSEFIRDMIREKIVSEEWEKNEEALGTITLVYSHHGNTLSKKLTSLQHKYHSAIMVSTHLHLDSHLCAETIIVKSKADTIREIRNMLASQKGVYHASLSLSSTGKKLA